MYALMKLTTQLLSVLVALGTLISFILDMCEPTILICLCPGGYTGTFLLIFIYLHNLSIIRYHRLQVYFPCVSQFECLSK